MKTVEEIRDFFEKDRYVKANGVVIDLANSEYAICSIDVNENHLNAGDCVQGGMVYTLADFAFAVLANTIHPVTVTQSASISYIAPAYNCKKLFAKAREIARVKHNCVVEVTVYDENEKTVAVMTANGFIKAQF